MGEYCRGLIMERTLRQFRNLARGISAQIMFGLLMTESDSYLVAKRQLWKNENKLLKGLSHKPFEDCICTVSRSS
jgi:hypothetical protein